VLTVHLIKYCNFIATIIFRRYHKKNESEKRLDGKRILIVEDEQEVLQMIEAKLRENGFFVTCTASGKESVELARAEQPDVILMDIILPDIAGSDVVKLLAETGATSDIPVIFLSGIVTKGEEADGCSQIKVGSRQYDAIAKPFTFRELLDRIERTINLTA